MTATDELRRMLDERGVEYEVDDAKTVMVTRWRAYGDWVSFIEYDNGDTKFCIDARRLTPEQAIAATLGAGTCHDSNKRFNAWQCSECGATLLLMFDDCDEPTYSVDGVADVPRYCPNCGRRVVTDG